MSRFGKRYDESFRKEAVRLVLEDGVTKSKVCRDLGVSVATLYKWLDEAEARKAGGGSGMEGEHEELIRLRKENAQLRQERDILKKATAFFAKESK
jgi:transposase